MATDHLVRGVQDRLGFKPHVAQLDITPELSSSDRERDHAALTEILEITETRCGQLGWSFDASYDEGGELLRVDVWKYAA